MSSSVTPDERDKHQDRIEEQIRTHLAKDYPLILWHYTNGNALIDIIRDGKLFSTQVSRVNDTTECAYSINMLREAFKKARHKNASCKDVIFLLDYIDSNISADTTTSEWFITCFSEKCDDLSQWRAYGNGENGYSIGFCGPKIAPIALGEDSLLVPVNYCQKTHTMICDAVAQATIQFFLTGWYARQRSGVDIEEWATSFLSV